MKTYFLYACGIYNLAFAIFHIFFWKLFNWKKDLQKNSPANRVIIQILNLRLIYIFLLMAALYLFFSLQLIDGRLGLALLIGFFGFWIGRTLEQFIFLRVKSTMVHVLTAIFITGSIIHLIPLVI